MQPLSPAREYPSCFRDVRPTICPGVDITYPNLVKHARDYGLNRVPESRRPCFNSFWDFNRGFISVIGMVLPQLLAPASYKVRLADCPDPWFDHARPRPQTRPDADWEYTIELFVNLRLVISAVWTKHDPYVGHLMTVGGNARKIRSE